MSGGDGTAAVAVAVKLTGDPLASARTARAACPPPAGPSRHAVLATPLPSVLDVAGSSDPPVVVQVTAWPVTGLPLPLVTSTASAVGNGPPAGPDWFWPAWTAIVRFEGPV